MAIQDEIEVCIITAPRDIATLNYSIYSMRKQIDCYINIFAEPGPLQVTGGDMNILINHERLGVFKNYHNALNWYLKNSKKPYIWITEDDYVYNSTLKTRLNEVLSYKDEFGFFNMFTNYWNPAFPNPMPEGWTDLRLNYWDAWMMSYIMRRGTVERLVKDSCYLNYLDTTDKNIDGATAETFKRLGLAMFYHNPSPSCSAVVTSTIGHECKTDGLHFKLNI